MGDDEKTSATAKIRCWCGQASATQKMTGPTSICHCSICRYTTGVLFLSALKLHEKPPFVNQLKRYDSTEKVSRYFCPTCGTHVMFQEIKSGKWGVCSGAVDQILDGGNAIEDIKSHEFVGDTIDGGLAICLTAAGGKAVELFRQGPDEPALNVSSYLSSVESTAGSLADRIDVSERLNASCHCGGVQYRITQPNEDSWRCSSPWPDLIKPSQSGHSTNDEDIKWWLTDNGTKYLAGTCACRSCRLATGVPIQTWAFVPRANIQKLDGSAWDFKGGSLQRYDSAPGVYREFCGVCGATAFWHCDERPDLIDVSVGLLRASEGARAEKWLKWYPGRVSFREDALEGSIVPDFEQGLDALSGKHR